MHAVGNWRLGWSPVDASVRTIRIDTHSQYCSQPNFMILRLVCVGMTARAWRVHEARINSRSSLWSLSQLEAMHGHAAIVARRRPHVTACSHDVYATTLRRCSACQLRRKFATEACPVLGCSTVLRSRVRRASRFRRAVAACVNDGHVGEQAFHRTSSACAQCPRVRPIASA